MRERAAASPAPCEGTGDNIEKDRGAVGRSLSSPPSKGLGRGLSSSFKKPSALQFAYRLLSYRGRSEKEMREKLKLKGYDEPDIEAAIRSLLSYSLLDDRRLASSLKRYAEETRKLSISGTRKYLKERGIPGEIIDETLKDSDETETAQKLVEKKMKFLHNYPVGEIMRKLYGALYRKGYSMETIAEVLKPFRRKEDVS